MRALTLALGLLSIGLAQAQQSPQPVIKAVDDWLRTHTLGLPGQVSWEIGPIDPANQLPPCRRFEISLPAGARLWGRSHVAVRCLEPAPWRIHVSVQVRVKGDYLVTARPIAAGQVITHEDLAHVTGDLTELPASLLTDSSRAVGKTASVALPAGQPLRADLLKAALVIRQGQTVRVVSRGPGFQVSNEGRALGHAHEGQVAQVRLANGQVISGIALPDGSVEVRP